MKTKEKEYLIDKKTGLKVEIKSGDYKKAVEELNRLKAAVLLASTI